MGVLDLAGRDWSSPSPWTASVDNKLLTTDCHFKTIVLLKRSFIINDTTYRSKTVVSRILLLSVCTFDSTWA